MKVSTFRPTGVRLAAGAESLANVDTDSHIFVHCLERPKVDGHQTGI